MYENNPNITQEIRSFRKAKVLTGMYTVLLCDDDAIFLEQLRSRVSEILSKNDLRVRLHSFSGMEEIGDAILSQTDIAILDIDFADKQYNGIGIARRLRAFRDDAVIIFLTNYVEYAPEGYEVRAFRYLLKSDLDRKLALYLGQAVSIFQSESETIRFQINGEIINIFVKNILYIESQLHKIKVFTQLPNSKKIGVYTFNSSIGEMETELSGKGFLRIHKSYLVNMAHIQKYTCHLAQLDNGMTLRASAARYAEQKERYLLWKGAVING